ncbi:MAG TPA: hypothetical protein VM580_18815 [Labilithrix sp.]|nr:hypothetical protein [Labilithrix sp.]
MTAHAADPLFAAVDLRVDIDGVPACDGLTLETKGQRVVVLGAPRALFEATTGIARAVRGTCSVRGVPASVAVTRGIVAGVAMDPPMPPRWTVTEYVRWSARLAGVPSDLSRTRADAAIEKLYLGAMAKTELSRVVPHARRATLVASALATGAEVIALDDPLGALADDVAPDYAKILVDALDESAWVVFAPRMPLGSPIAQAADEAIVATSTRVDAAGPPAELAARERRFVVRISGPLDAIASALSARGVRVEAQGAHLLFDLGPDVRTSELMDICARANIAVLELVPLVRALS